MNGGGYLSKKGLKGTGNDPAGPCVVPLSFPTDDG